jgi:hypothetical protein
MTILINEVDGFRFEAPNEMRLLRQKMDSDEKLVRKTLVKVWIRILEKYARPGAVIPSPEALRRELMRVGLEAAVDAVVDDHWVVFSWMIRDEIREKIDRGLDRFDIVEFIEDVKLAQKEPGMLDLLRARIKRHVMEDL